MFFRQLEQSLGCRRLWKDNLVSWCEVVSGAVVQLEERLILYQEVVFSNPTVSTKSTKMVLPRTIIQLSARVYRSGHLF